MITNTSMTLTFFDRYLNSRQVAIVLTGLCLLLGTSVLIGWYLKNLTLIQVRPEFVPMQYNTALGFVIIGSGILLCVTKNIQLARIFAVFLILLGSMTLLQFIASVNLGIDQLFMEHYITVETSDPGRMAPNTALCFSLSGIALLVGLVSSNRARYQFIEGILGALVIGLGVVALAGYIVGIETAYGWGQLTRMAVHTASGFVLAGFAVTAAAWYKHDGQMILFPSWLPVAVFIAVMTVTVSLWQAFVVQDIKHSPYETNIESILHYSLLPFGFLLALALGLSLHLIRFAWIKNHEALTALYQSRMQSQKNSALLLNAGDGIHILDEKGRLVEVSNSFCDLLGFSRNEILGKHISEYIVGASGGEFSSMFEKPTIGQLSFETRYKSKSGKDHHVERTINPVQIGNETLFFCSARDVTERNQYIA